MVFVVCSGFVFGKYFERKGCGLWCFGIDLF